MKPLQDVHKIHLNIFSLHYRFNHDHLLGLFFVDWLIDWIEFYAISAIFQPCNGGYYSLNDFEVPLVALTSLLFIEIQWNGLLRAKGVVILDTGHHLTSHPTDIFSGINNSIYSVSFIKRYWKKLKDIFFFKINNRSFCLIKFEWQYFDL